MLGLNTWQYHAGGPLAAVLQTIINLSLAIVLAGAVQYAASWPGRLLNARPLAFIGRISYSVYLWQQLFLSPPEAGSPWPVHPLTAVFGIAAAALLSYYLVERPVARFREFTKLRQTADGENIGLWRAAGS